MHYTRLKLKDIGCHKALDIQFVRGSVAICGPNGSGKSTIISSLYGLPTNDWSRICGGRTGVVRLDAPASEGAATGWIEHAGTEFVVHREFALRRDTHRLEEKGCPTVTGATKVNDRVREILGVDRQVLDLCVFKKQMDLAGFLTGAPAERSMVFHALCRTKACEDMWDHLGRVGADMGSRASVLGDPADVDRLTLELQNAREQLAAARKVVADCEKKCLSETGRRRAEEVVRRANAHRATVLRVGDLQAELARLADRLKPLAANEQTCAVNAADARKAAAVSAATLAAAKAALAAHVLASDQAQKRTRIQAEVDKLLAVLAKCQPRDKLVKIAETDLQALQRDLYAGTAEQLRIAQRLETFSAGGVVECPTCGTAVEAIHEHLEQDGKRLSELDIANRALKAELETKETRIRTAKAALGQREGFERQLETWKAQLAAVTEVGKLLTAEKVRELEQKVRTAEDAQTVATAADRALTVATTQRQSLEMIITGKQRELSELEAGAVEAVSPALEKKAIAALDADTSARTDLARARGQLSPLEQLVERTAAALKTASGRLGEARALLDSAAVLERARDILHRTALPAAVAKIAIQQLVLRMERSLALFGHPFTLSVADGLTFMAAVPGRSPLPAAYLSVGQQAVLALAFWDAVALLWAHDLGCQALDEPTANMDADNRAYLARAIEAVTLQARGSRQVIMVTHADELRPAFDQVIDLGAL